MRALLLGFVLLAAGCGGGAVSAAALVEKQDGTVKATTCAKAGLMDYAAERETVYECRTLGKIVRCFVVVDGVAHDVSDRKGLIEADRPLACEPLPG